ncbi:phospholipase D family protein [Methylocystis echinoides]|nr:phospholipase D-like domain-containing protein [Methylocystis echinoides]
MKTSRLILNAINGRYLREITDNAAKDCQYVEAAVAYATQEQLFEWCWNHHIRLRFWGRFDEGVPVAPHILKRFLDRRSPNFVCKLLPHLHAKVIWWHGIGAYIGSANLTDRAWYSNVEAGFYFDESDMLAFGIDEQLRSFFEEVDTHASPLTEELYSTIRDRQRELDFLHERDRDNQKRFLQTPCVKQWAGLLHVSPRSATEKQKQAFLSEWFSTLQILRDIGTRVSDEEFRPDWIPSDVPPGAQADQFLHAHYYNRVIGLDRRSYYEEMFEENKGNPENALRNAMVWWRSLPSPPSNEDQMLFEWAPFLRRELARERILGLSERDFEAVCQRVWAIQDHARRMPNVTLNLPQDQKHTVAVKTKALSHYLFEKKAPNGSNVLEVLYHVLYGGTHGSLPDRIWDTTLAGQWRIEHLGMSAIGELVGWALPDDFPPRNNRTSKSLRSLGFPVDARD